MTQPGNPSPRLDTAAPTVGGEDVGPDEGPDPPDLEPDWHLIQRPAYHHWRDSNRTAPFTDPDKQARIAARAEGAESDPERWRRDGEGWARFRGLGKRGNPGVIASDSFDLGIAFRELADGRAALLEAHRLPDSREKREAISRSLGKLALASRAIDTVVIRRGGTPGDMG